MRAFIASAVVRATAAFVLLTAAAPAHAQQLSVPGDGGSYAAPFSATTSRFVQTFQRPVAGLNFLQGFSFSLGDLNDGGTGATLGFRASIFTVSSNQLGTELFQSDVQTGSGNYFGFDDYGFTTFNLALDPNVSTFALVLRGVSGAGENVIAAAASDHAGGALYLADANGQLTLEGGTSDIAFEAAFSATAVPEPATIVLLGAGLVGVGIVARRKRVG